MPTKAEAGGWEWGIQWQPHPFFITQKWHFVSMVSHAFSANFPGCGPPYFCHFILSFYSQQLSPPLFHTPNPTFQHSAPLPNRWHMTKPRAHRVSAKTLCAVLCPSFQRPSSGWSFDPLKVSFCPRWFPCCVVGVVSKCRNLSLPSTSSQGCWSLFWFLFSCFLSLS